MSTITSTKFMCETPASAKLIEQVVGKMKPLDPQATRFTKIRNVVADFFTFFVNLGAKALGTDRGAQLKMRASLVGVAHGLSVRNEMTNVLTSVTHFAERVKQKFPTASDLYVACLFMKTLDTLSKERKQPAAVLNNQQIADLGEQVKTVLGIPPEVPNVEVPKKSHKKQMIALGALVAGLVVGALAVYAFSGTQGPAPATYPTCPINGSLQQTFGTCPSLSKPLQTAIHSVKNLVVTQYNPFHGTGTV